MSANDGRPYTQNQAKTGYLRVYPVSGAPTTNAGVKVNNSLDLEFSTATPTGEVLVEDGAHELLFDDTTGDVLYEG